MKAQYVFDLRKTAISAERFICNIAGFPWISNNAKTGEPEPDKQKTLRWALIQKRATDGKYYFETLDDSDFENVPVEIINKFNNDFPHTIEEKQSDWVEG